MRPSKRHDAPHDADADKPRGGKPAGVEPEKKDEEAEENEGGIVKEDDDDQS